MRVVGDSVPADRAPSHELGEDDAGREGTMRIMCEGVEGVEVMCQLAKVLIAKDR